MPAGRYFKRFRMELDLRTLPPVGPVAGFAFVPWDDGLLDLHAEVKYRCFQGELDGEVFTNLSGRTGCQLLMRAIRESAGFCPQATWLATTPAGSVGTVQGLFDEAGFGAIQNLGVMAGYRGHGLGEALMVRALHGFRTAGGRRAVLEVTAENVSAVRLYRRLGFRAYKTVYRETDRSVELPLGAGI